MIPLPLTWSISAGTQPKIPCFLSEKWVLQKALSNECKLYSCNVSAFFASLYSTIVISWHWATGSDSCHNVQWQSRYGWTALEELYWPVRLLWPDVSPAMKWIQVLIVTNFPSMYVVKPTLFDSSSIWSVIRRRQLCSSWSLLIGRLLLDLPTP